MHLRGAQEASLALDCQVTYRLTQRPPCVMATPIVAYSPHWCLGKGFSMERFGSRPRGEIGVENLEREIGLRRSKGSGAAYVWRVTN